jgi:ribosomal small subunit protein bTHX
VLFALVVFACMACSALAFAPASLPLSQSRSVRAQSCGPTMLITPESASVLSLAVTAETPLTVVDGRGDRRTKKGKIFFKSFGKVCLRSQQLNSV